MRLNPWMGPPSSDMQLDQSTGGFSHVTRRQANVVKATSRSFLDKLLFRQDTDGPERHHTGVSTEEHSRPTVVQHKPVDSLCPMYFIGTFIKIPYACNLTEAHPYAVEHQHKVSIVVSLHSPVQEVCGKTPKSNRFTADVKGKRPRWCMETYLSMYRMKYQITSKACISSIFHLLQKKKSV